MEKNELSHFYRIRYERKLKIVFTFTYYNDDFIIVFTSSHYYPFRPTRSNFCVSNDEQVALTKGNKNENNIALTFNISWGEEKVYDILNVLNEHKVRATFFVSGEWAERHPQIMEEISEAWTRSRNVRLSL